MSDILIYFLIIVSVYFLANSILRLSAKVERLILRQDRLERRVDKHLIRDVDDGK